MYSVAELKNISNHVQQLKRIAAQLVQFQPLADESIQESLQLQWIKLAKKGVITVEDASGLKQ